MKKLHELVFLTPLALVLWASLNSIKLKTSKIQVYRMEYNRETGNENVKSRKIHYQTSQPGEKTKDSKPPLYDLHQDLGEQIHRRFSPNKGSFNNQRKPHPRFIIRKAKIGVLAAVKTTSCISLSSFSILVDRLKRIPQCDSLRETK